jgi:Tfp pilus assembly protein PilO
VSRTFRLLIGVVVIAAAAGGYWKFVLAPKRAQADKLATEVTVTQAQLDQAKATLVSYKQAKTEYRDNYAKIIRLGKAVPADDDTRSLVVQVDAAAKRSGVDFDNIDLISGGGMVAAGSNVTTEQSATSLPPGAINGGSFAVMPFSLAFTGKFDTLSNFFSRLERFVTLDGEKIAVDGRLLRVEKIQLKPIDDGWPSIQAQAAVTAYVVPQSSDPASGATAQGPAGTTTAPGGTSTSTSSTPSASSDTGTTTSTSSNPGSDLR